MRKFLYAIFTIFILFVVFIIGIVVGTTRSGNIGFDGSDKVAVLTVQDIILDSKEYLESIEKIKRNKSIKALVVRINSPGGAVGPAQEIYSEIEKLKIEMPVVASMGSVAASGGYYIACAAEKIYANPGTITGSIGVIAQFVSYKDLLKWAKLDVEVIKSGKFKDIGSPLRTMSPEEKSYIQRLIDNVHSQFKNTVSETRGISSKDINIIADGRIFSGEQAMKFKLVDELGTINDAIISASEIAGIEDPEVINFPEEKSALYELLVSKLGFNNAFSKIPGFNGFGVYYLVDIIH